MANHSEGYIAVGQEQPRHQQQQQQQLLLECAIKHQHGPDAPEKHVEEQDQIQVQDQSLESTIDGSTVNDADGGGGGGDTGNESASIGTETGDVSAASAPNDTCLNQSTVIRIDENQVRSLLNTSTNDTSLTAGAKIGTSHKFPSLKKYYEFGPWVGRNRKAVCLACKLQTSSSQPDRLLRHLNKCTALTEEDKVQVREMMNERTANKRKSPGPPRNKRDSDYVLDYGDDSHPVGDDFSLPNNSQCQIIHTVPSKRMKADRNSQIDEALTRFIMMCRVPLKTIHSKEFVELVRALNPDYQIPSRETITNVLIPGLLNII